MKGLVVSVGAATIIAFGLNSGANGQSPDNEPTGNHESGGMDRAGLHSVMRTGTRQLRRRRKDNDDALDVNGTVSADNTSCCGGSSHTHILRLLSRNDRYIANNQRSGSSPPVNPWAV